VASVSGCSALGIQTVTNTPEITPDVEPTVEAVVATLAQPTPTPSPEVEIPAATATEIVPIEGGADVGDQVSSFQTGNWQITTYEGVTTQISNWGKSLKDPVTDWSETPNIDSPSHNFKAANGTYWYAGQNYYCQQDQRCDLNNPARSIRVVTADYNIPNIDACKADANRQGCAFIWVNVGEVNAMFRNVNIDYGWTESGPYWNGDAMPETLWAVSSFISWDMLNKSGGTDVGGNCSVADGCSSIHVTIIVTSGNQLLLKATTVVNR